MGLLATSYSTEGLGKTAALRPVPDPVRSCSSSTDGSREPMGIAGCGGSVQLDVFVDFTGHSTAG